MPRIMWDSVNARSIYNQTRNPQMVAGYVDKIVLQPWSQADWDLFPSAVKVQIVKKASSNFGHVLDVEPGDATPAQAPGWVKMRREAGLSTPTIYCNLSTWPSVQQAFRDQGVAQPLYWIAKYDDVKNFPVLNGITAIAKQYHGNDPANYDLSYVADFWPGVDGVANMALDAGDKAYIEDQITNHPGWWYAPRFRGNENYAQVILGGLGSLPGMTQALTNLTNLVIADAANDVTAAQVSDAVMSRLTVEIGPIVRDAIDAALASVHVDVDAQAIADTVINTLHDKLAPAV